MATKLFKFTAYDNYQEDYIREIDEDEIEDVTNSYGMWIESSRFELDDSNFEENEDGTWFLDSCYDESDVLELFEKEVSNFDRDNLTNDLKAALIKASTYSIDTSDEADSTSCYELSITIGSNGDNEYFLSIEDIDPIVVGKKISEWDGSNWKDTDLSSDCWEGEFPEDVTEEYENWEDKEYIASTEWTTGNQVRWHSLVNKHSEKVLVIEERTQWQGRHNTFSIVDNEDIREYLEDTFDDDNDYNRRAIEERFDILNIDDLVTLYKGENSILESNYYQEKALFDDYVSSYCKEGGYNEDDLSLDQLRECAYNFINY